MIPVPEVTELPSLPDCVWPAAPAPAVVPALVPSACISRALLAGFAAAMRGQGLALAPQRLRYDRLYAFERIAAAHAAGDAGLRAQALQLFELFNAWPRD
ncbi:MAG: hypothetical protein KBC73_14925 [Burkholderiaceae bacterium]|nr:hypothetical protein [Burkholderiaceae bacterium]